ncbi:hypothetical protein X975_16611, partial [Stegodyphus mimosarum]
MLTFVESRRGFSLLLRGYTFKREKALSTKVIWRCSLYEKLKCTARCHTYLNSVIKEIG